MGASGSQFQIEIEDRCRARQRKFFAGWSETEHLGFKDPLTVIGKVENIESGLVGGSYQLQLFREAVTVAPGMGFLPECTYP